MIKGRPNFRLWITVISTHWQLKVRMFFERGTTEIGNTDKVWHYDMRTNTPNYGKRTPFTVAAFEGFIKAHTGDLSTENLDLEYDGKVKFI